MAMKIATKSRDFVHKLNFIFFTFYSISLLTLNRQHVSETLPRQIKFFHSSTFTNTSNNFSHTFLVLDCVCGFLRGFTME